MNEKLKKLLKENSKNIEEELEKFLPKKIDLEWINENLGETEWSHDIIAYNNSAIKPVWELLERGGKRMRPLLMKLSYDVIGGNKTILKYMIIPELIHNGTLITDDIEDNSEIRRGKPCIHKIFGNDIAINSGNLIFFLPLLIIIKDESLDLKIKNRIYELINKEMIRLHFGQSMDIWWHNNNSKITEKEYFQMCSYKTGTLARMSAKMGAILGGANEKQVEALGNFADSIGIAFQIQDDILNITNTKWGKDLGDDITEGKKSLIVIKTLNKANEKDRQRLNEILKMQTREKKLIEEAIFILKKYGAIDECKRIAKKIVFDAWNKVKLEIPNSKSKQELMSLANFMINRNF